MSLRQEVILTPGTTDSVETIEFDVERGKPIYIGLYPQANLLSAELAILTKKAPDGTFVKQTDDNGDLEYGLDRTGDTIYTTGTYKLTVATRTSSWGIYKQDAFL